MSKLYLYNYNNYFNRIVKKESSLANYGTPIYSLSETNFDENDGVSATHIVNYAGFDGDYLIITKVINNVETIQSRWFVIENKKIRGGQHSLRLRRDLIVDYYDKIIKAPALINRGMIRDYKSPLIYNDEGFSFNQIKTKEELIGAHSPWYILYVKKNAPSINDSINIGEQHYDIEIQNTIGDSIFKTANYQQLIDKIVNINSIVDYSFWNPNNLLVKFNISNSGIEHNSSYPFNYGDYIWFDQDYTTCITEINEAFTQTGVIPNVMTKLEAEVSFTSNITDSTLADIYEANGKVVKTSDNKYYRITIAETVESVEGYTLSTSDLTTYMQGIINTTDLTRTGQWGSKAFSYTANKKTIQVTATEISAGSISVAINFSTKQNTLDADYNILAIPYVDNNIYPTASVTMDPSGFRTTNEISKKIVDLIVSKWGSTYIVDMQLVPYCPLAYIKTPYPFLDFNPTGEPIFDVEASGIDSIKYAYGKQTIGNKDLGFLILFLETSKFTFDINLSTYIPPVPNEPRYQYILPSIARKSYDATTITRLVSPNYNGVFEFSIAKNNGIKGYNVDITLKPYNPYIKINPWFSGLYGKDFDDSRGLICGGDFSLPIITNAFTDYELRNKNYQLAFERQIQHMDFEFSKQRTEALFGATVGTIGASVGGAIAGGKFGGVSGAVGGAVGGAFASAVGGAIDYSIMKERQAEQKDLTIDMFNYQLGNIKALPYNLNKITPLNNNFKLYPFIETYEATQEELDIFINKIKYTSMRVNAIGTLEQYKGYYVSASLIRLLDIDVPTHELNEIYDEIMKGVYI